MAGFEEISKMKLSELGDQEIAPEEEAVDIETAKILEDLARDTAGEAEQKETKQQENVLEDVENQTGSGQEKMSEPVGKHFYIDARIHEKEMIAFLFGHNYRQPLMIFATLIGIFWPIAMIIQNQGNLWVAVVVLLLFLVAFPLNTWNKARMAIKNNPMYANTFHYMLDEWGLHLELDENAIDVEWNRMFKVMFLKSTVVLYTGKLNAYLIPTGAMGEQKEEIIPFIKAKMIHR